MRTSWAAGLLVFVCVGCGDATTTTDSASGGDDSAVESGGASVSAVYTGTDIVDATPDATGENAWYLADGGDSLCVGPMDGSADASCLTGWLYHADNVTFDDSGEHIVVTAAAADQQDALIAAAVAIGIAAGVYAATSGGKKAAADDPGFVYLDETIPYAPVALDSVDDWIYFSGTNTGEGSPGVFRVPLAGGDVEVVQTGYPEVPTGIVVSAEGTVYAAAAGALYEGATAIASGLTLGTPAGLALTPDDGSVMVSSLAADGSSQALLVNRTDHSQTPFNQGISQNVGSGGLHRAQQDESLYAWCGVTVGTGGTVYRIDLN